MMAGLPLRRQSSQSIRWMQSLSCSFSAILFLCAICYIHRGGFAKADKKTGLQAEPDPDHPSEMHAPLSAWLWWLFGLYMFWAQATVCDKYFVPSVQVCSDTFKIPDDVAGATLMAFGCNGPELAVNVIAIFITKSQVGVGTIVGSDVFNLLVIAGISILATPQGYAKLDASRIGRDVLFYAISIVLLMFVISHGVVKLWQAIGLALMAVAYGVAVAYWGRLDALWHRQELTADSTPTSRDCSDFYNPTSSGGSDSLVGNSNTSAAHGHDPEAGQALLEQGVVLGVRKGGRRGRFESRTVGREKWANRCLKLNKEIGTLSILRNSDRGMVRSSSAPNVLQSFTKATDASRSTRECLMLGGASGEMSIALKDVLNCEADTGTTFVLQYIDRTARRPRFRLGLPTATLEFRAVNKCEQELCIAVIAGQPVFTEPDAQEFADLVQEHRQAVEALDPSSARTSKQHLYSIVSWFCFPVLLALELTVPKCFAPSTKRLWPLTFVVSMVWLAFFSYWICVMADEVHAEFGIPESLLGLTLTSIGTSFPNCIASYIVARKGQCSMAVANALGSNIQNVFLALGFPWLVNAAIQGGEFKQSRNGITSGVVSMAASLLLFVVFLVWGRCSLTKYAAVTFLLAYVLFFVMTVYDAYELI